MDKKEAEFVQQQRDANAQRAALVLKQEEIKQKKAKYAQGMVDLLQAVTTYKLEQTKKCLEQLTAIDPENELQLWTPQHDKMEIYVSSILNNAERAGKFEIAQQIARAIDVFDQKYNQPITQK